MKMTHFAGLLAAPLMVLTLGLSARAADSAVPTPCKDGTTSQATGRGACSGHGGVQKAPAIPAGATAMCKDGSFSKSKQHSGACASHDGVAKWLTPE